MKKKNKLYSVFYFNPPKRVEKKLWRKVLEFGLVNGLDSFNLVYWSMEVLNKKIWEYKAKEYVFEDPHVYGLDGSKPWCLEGIFNKNSIKEFLDINQFGFGFDSLQIYSKNSKLELKMYSYGGIHFEGLDRLQLGSLKKIILGAGWKTVFKTEGNTANYYVLDPTKKMDVEIENTSTDKNKLIWGFLLKLALQAGLWKVKAVYEGGKELEMGLKKHSLNKICKILPEQGLTNCLVYGKPKETSISFKPPGAFSIIRLREPFMPDVSLFTTNNKLCISTRKSQLPPYH